MSKHEDAPTPGGTIPYTDLWSRPGFLIRRLHQLHVAMFLEECKAFDVTPVQYALLSALYDGREMDQVSIAAEIGIDRNNAADVIRRLERRGFVERVPSTADRRAKLSRITAAGRRFVEEAHGAMERAQSRFTASLSERDRKRLMELLQRLMRENNDSGRAPLRTPGEPS